MICCVCLNSILGIKMFWSQIMGKASNINIFCNDPQIGLFVAKKNVFSLLGASLILVLYPAATSRYAQIEIKKQRPINADIQIIAVAITAARTIPAAVWYLLQRRIQTVEMKRKITAVAQQQPILIVGPPANLTAGEIDQVLLQVLVRIAAGLGHLQRLHHVLLVVIGTNQDQVELFPVQRARVQALRPLHNALLAENVVAAFGRADLLLAEARQADGTLFRCLVVAAVR